MTLVSSSSSPANQQPAEVAELPVAMATGEGGSECRPGGWVTEPTGRDRKWAGQEVGRTGSRWVRKWAGQKEGGAGTGRVRNWTVQEVGGTGSGCVRKWAGQEVTYRSQ